MLCILLCGIRIGFLIEKVMYLCYPCNLTVASIIMEGQLDRVKKESDIWLCACAGYSAVYRIIFCQKEQADSGAG
jgi:hypothetical protein